MATTTSTTKDRTSSFSRNPRVGPTSQVPGLKPGPNGVVFLSSGIPDLDRMLGGGFSLGSLIMVMEDPEAPHHMLLLRNFMAQGLVHNEPLLYASPSKDPKGFLGTLPNPMSPKDDKPRDHGTEQDKDLRIAWQYKKYARENEPGYDIRDSKLEYCNNFDLRKPLERQHFRGKHIDFVSTYFISVAPHFYPKTQVVLVAFLVAAALLFNHFVLLSVDTSTRTGIYLLL